MPRCTPKVSRTRVSQQESSEVPEGHVTQQIRKGYKYRNRLIRPAGVVVAKKSGSLKS
jgi:molecular chaperone GrpE (heat shock protein)